MVGAGQGLRARARLFWLGLCELLLDHRGTVLASEADLATRSLQVAALGSLAHKLGDVAQDKSSQQPGSSESTEAEWQLAAGRPGGGAAQLEEAKAALQLARQQEEALQQQVGVAAPFQPVHPCWAASAASCQPCTPALLHSAALPRPVASMPRSLPAGGAGAAAAGAHH